MKKIHLYTLLLVASTLFTCKKDHSNTSKPNANEKKYKIAFSLSDFSQVITGSAGKLQNNAVVSDPAIIRSMFDVIYLQVGDSSGRFVGKRYSGKAYTTGSITDSLGSGKYVIRICAGQTGLKGPLASDITYNIYPPAGVDADATPAAWGDTFYKSFLLTVNNADVNLNVTLERIVGRIEVDIKDVLPLDAYSFNMTVVNDAFEYDYKGIPIFSGLQPKTFTTNAVIIPDSSKIKSNFKFRYITANTTTTHPLTFTLFCKRKDGSVIAQRQFPATTVQKNQSKVFTGNFFGTANNNAGFQVSIDTRWITGDPANNQSF